jgi:hypothetical protein
VKYKPGGSRLIYTMLNYTCFCSSFSETSDSDIVETEAAELDSYFLDFLEDFFTLLECFIFLSPDLECLFLSFFDLLCFGFFEDCLKETPTGEDFFGIIYPGIEIGGTPTGFRAGPLTEAIGDAGTLGLEDSYTKA